VRFATRRETKAAPPAPVGSTSDRRAQPRAAVQHKTGISFELKAVDDAKHTFQGLAATWALDAGGDVIRKGAFARTLDHWRAQKKRRPVPLIDQHNYGSIRHVIGMMTEAEETADGLLATFAMVPDDADADAAFRRVKGGFVTGLSIGYEAVTVTMPSDEERRQGVWRYLDEVKLREVSVVVWGMNEEALTDPGTAKARAAALLAKGATKTLTDDERAQLEGVRDQIDALLASSDSAAGDDSAGDSGKQGLAPDDPKRLRMEAEYRDLVIRSIRSLATL
jgi:uncharacterized protein